MNDSALLSLPPELQDIIACYTTRPSELKNLCLTCQQLRKVATPKLYHSVDLRLDGHDIVEEDDGFLGVDNPGHQYVRHLRFDVSSAIGISPFKAEQVAFQQSIKRVLHVLPWHKLETFTTPPYLEIDGPTFSMLCAQQRHIRTLAIGQLMSRLPSNKQPLQAPFKQLTSLILPPDAEAADFDLYAGLIQNASNLRHLTVSTGEFAREEAHRSPWKALHQKSQGRRALDESRALGLESLTLDGQCFHDDGQFFTTTIQFENLRDLKLEASIWLHGLLRAMTSRFRVTTPRLRGLDIDGTDSKQEDLEAIEKLLKSFSCLEYFKLSATPDDDGRRLKFDLSSLDNHCKTLSDFYLALKTARWPRLRAIAKTELLDFFSRHRKLRQVAIPFPMASVFEIKHGFLDEVDNYTSVTKDLSNLEILRILTMPYEQRTNQRYSSMDEQIEAEGTYGCVGNVGALATHIIGHLVRARQHPKLKLLCIGSGEELEGFDLERLMPVDGHHTNCYYPGQQRDCFGRQQTVAIYTEAHLVKYDLPHFDALSKHEETVFFDTGLGLGDYNLSTSMS